MKNIALILIILSAVAGGGAYVYSKWKKVPHSDEEMLPAPVAEEQTGPKTPDREPPIADAKEEPEPAAPTAEKPKAKIKAAAGHFELSRPAGPHDDADPSDNPGFGKAREKRLWEIFKSDKDLARSIRVKDIRCRVDTCIVQAEAISGDADRFQSLMFALTKQYPWLGNKIDVTTQEGDAGIARFVYFHETPK